MIIFLPGSLQSDGQETSLPSLWSGGVRSVLRQQGTDQVQELRDSQGLSQML